MVDDIILSKAESIERCLRRVDEDYGGDPVRFREDFTIQDAVVLNLQRACQAAIDLALHLVRVRRLGLPRESRDAFDLLWRAGLLSRELSSRLQKMVGFRNVAIHDYQQLDLGIVQAIIERDKEELRRFAQLAIRSLQQAG